MELDQLYKRLNILPYKRLELFAKHPDLVAMRDDLVLEEITLLNQTAHFGHARQKLDTHIFHPWEGGEGKVPLQYQISRVELAKIAISGGRFDNAINLLDECLVYPHHLGEGKLYGAQENDFYYLLGICYQAKGDVEKARECFTEATLAPPNRLRQCTTTMPNQTRFSTPASPSAHSVWKIKPALISTAL